ncbi:helix-turn-helix domain-containing protein [Saccharobesus litoralis]|nr:AraC family transcriptional regulator [Saccharobesus litoralis]
MPIISSQLLLMVLLYFVVIYRGVLKGRNLFSCFLVVFITFLLCRSVQEFAQDTTKLFLLYFRISLLFSIGFPTLIAALFLQSKIQVDRLTWVILFGAGSFISLFYSMSHDVAHHGVYFSKQIANFLPFELSTHTHRYTSTVGICVMLLLPCLYLLYKQLMDERNKITLAFLTGALCFGFFFLMSMFLFRFYWIYGIGAALLAACWSYAVYLDITEMKGKTFLLTEELNLLLRSGNKNIQPELRQMLENIELQSQGDLDHYKLKVREILSLLTDSTIDAGGDKKALLDRNEQKINAISQSQDIAAVRQLATCEVIELSATISDIPTKRSEQVVEQVTRYIHEQFSGQFDFSELSKQLGMSESYIRRIFKKQTNQTINQYLSDYRIEQAKILLQSLSVTDTAFSVGFNDANYFSTVFKKLTGQSPTEYQQSLVST